MQLIILPTMACNCRCRYCYQEHILYSMTKSSIDSIKRFINRRVQRGLDELRLEWFGGEPLLKKNVILDFTKFVKKTMQKTGQFVGSMTTNGTLLTIENLVQLVNSGVTSFQITLDGDQPRHNQLRPFVTGQGSYETISHNLHAVLQHTEIDCHIMIRLHFQKDNVEQTADFATTLGSVFGGDNRFSIHFHPIQPFGGLHDKEFAFFETEEEIVKAIQYLQTVIPSNTVAPIIRDVPCYASLPDSLCFWPGPMGRGVQISKCTVELEESRVGYLEEDGSVCIDSVPLTRWTQGSITGEKMALECPRRYLKNKH